MPWFKLYASLIDEEDYWMMPLEQQAVYVNLLCLACKSQPRGSFQVSELDKLARRVADGRRDVLEATLSYCTTAWRTRDGESTIRITDGRGYFTRWGELQQPPSSITSDSADEPESNSEEIRSENGGINSGFVPVLPTSRRKKVEGRSKREEGEKKDGTAEAEPPRADIADTIRILRLIEGATVRDDAATLEGLADGIDSYPEIDYRPVAQDYARWQNSLTTRKRHKDPVRGFLNQLKMRNERGDPRYFKHDPVMAQAWSAPDLDSFPPCNTDVWRAVREIVAQHAPAAYTQYFNSASDQMRDGCLLLTFVDGYDRDMAQQRYGDVVSTASARAGYPDLAIEYAVMGQDVRAAG